MDAGNGPAGGDEAGKLQDVFRFEDEPVVKFAKWLFTLSTTVGVLAGGLQVAGLPNLSGWGQLFFTLAIVAVASSLATAVWAVAAQLKVPANRAPDTTTITKPDRTTKPKNVFECAKARLKAWANASRQVDEELAAKAFSKEPNDTKWVFGLALGRSRRRKRLVLWSGALFALGLALAGLSPLVSSLERSRDRLEIEYVITHDSLTHLSANASGRGLKVGSIVRVELLHKDSTNMNIVISSGQAVADSTGRVELQVKMENLHADRDSIFIRLYKGGSPTDSVWVEYTRPAPK